MVKFLNKGVFGLGLCPMDIRQLRAGSPIMLRVPGTDIEVLLFAGHSDKQMIRDLKTEEVDPVAVDTNVIDLEWEPADRRVRGKEIITIRKGAI